MPEDLYAVLGVERSATADEIKRAYRRLAHKHHPDKAGGDEEKFKHINNAYQVLSDPQKRANYDRFGNADMGGGGGAGGPFGGFNSQGFNINMDDMGGFSDIFDQFFGGGGRRGPRRGQDATVDIEISFVESATRLSKEITLRMLGVCDTCHGNGAKPGTPIVECKTCHGSGSVTQAQQTVFGTFNQRATCPTCSGEGKVPKELCTTCRGEGRVRQDRKLEVTIPAGIADGQIIQVDSQGEAAPRGGAAGDLYIRVHVKPHPVLKREIDNVRIAQTISFADALLGTTVSIETLNGKEDLDIPAGTQPEAVIRMSGRGFPSLRGGSKGDELVTIHVSIPKKLSRRQKELAQQFKEAQGKKGFFG